MQARTGFTSSTPPEQLRSEIFRAGRTSRGDFAVVDLIYGVQLNRIAHVLSTLDARVQFHECPWSIDFVSL